MTTVTRVLQRQILPLDRDLDVVNLRGEMERAAAPPASRAA